VQDDDGDNDDNKLTHYRKIGIINRNKAKKQLSRR
jgi:hypothetical protein